MYYVVASKTCLQPLCYSAFNSKRFLCEPAIILYIHFDLYSLYSSEQSLNFLLQDFFCYLMACSVVFLICRLLWIKASPILKKCKCASFKGPEDTVLTAVNGCVMQNYWIHLSIMKARKGKGLKSISIRDRQTLTPTRIQSLSYPETPWIVLWTSQFVLPPSAQGTYPRP